MNDRLIDIILKLNPWWEGGVVLDKEKYIPRLQTSHLLLPDWDKLWMILVGPRQSGKTTLGKFIAQQLIKQKRYESLIYLNCDLLPIRQWLKTPLFIDQAIKQFGLKKPIFFIDEVQRLENPGLLLKSIVDLELPIKMMASGSSQLEIKSQVQEFLTGRHIEAVVLPLSYEEIGRVEEGQLYYGCYPGVYNSRQKEVLLKQLYQDYISKDIIEILKVGKPDIMQHLIGLIAHSTGQLVNYNQLANDARTSIPTVQNYCAMLEKTYTLFSLKPFVGNKRKEITANPVYYFIDNGFKNQALRKFSYTDQEKGLLIQSAVAQELLKYRAQHFGDFDIHYWRTQSGAEVDFVIYKNKENFIPVEIKYRNIQSPQVTRSLRSFIEAYQPKISIVITKDFNGEMAVQNCCVKFISFRNIILALKLIGEN